MLRDYQQRSIDMLYDWLRNNEGNPCVVLPTGAGKSHIIAAMCKDALQSWPETRILMLTHQRELISQNASKLREHWPNAPIGIYSAGLGKREIGEPITFAGIQSVRNRSAEIGHVDLCVIDECHLVGHNQEGGYRKLLGELTAINPNLRVIGLTASPYRLGHGLITDKPAIFDDLIEPVSIKELVDRGYLSVLRSKFTSLQLNTDGVAKRGGDYVEADLQRAIDTDDNNHAAVSEIIKYGAGRKSWLIFCTGVEHSNHIANLLIANGITADCVVGSTPKAQRDQILEKFKAGKIQALTNCAVLTTGFDHPGVDLIAMLRPTMSPALYLQSAGRGMRIAPGKADCLVLDFAGNVKTHGPITEIKPPKSKGDQTGNAPVKVCPNCDEIIAAQCKVCPACAHEFEVAEQEEKKAGFVLHNDDIMGIEGHEMMVEEWTFREHTSKASGIKMIKATYYGAWTDTPVSEYFAILHSGYAGLRARKELLSMAKNANCSAAIDALINFPSDLSELSSIVLIHKVCNEMNISKPPSMIEYRKDGKFFKILKRTWNESTTTAMAD